MSQFLILSEPIFIILFAQCLCRLSRSNCQVTPEVRAGFILVALAAAYCLIAPYVWGIPPTWPELILGAAVVLRQWSTSGQWACGIPHHVLKEGANG